jgi:TetR/AcrR family transcriptional regulator, transcriptional repressor for nem operon
MVMANHGTREELIEVGLKQIHSAGYTATGINQILELADVPKGSFYHHFASKDAFAKEVLEHYNSGEEQRWKSFLEDTKVSPLKRLRKYFKEMIAIYGRRGRSAGCLLGNMTLEIAEHNPKLRGVLRKSFDCWQNAIAKTIREAIEQQELPKTANANELAALLVNNWEGAQVRAKAEQSDKPLELFLDVAFNVLLKG